MDCKSPREQVDAEILDGVFELLGRIAALGEKVAQRLCVPAVFIKALHTLERPMAMKDLGKRMHCDPSFVTVVADMLEKRGLARREAHAGDRRVKNLVLTDDGLELKHQIEAEITGCMPWTCALTPDERAQLLVLIRKMLAALPEAAGTVPPVSPAAGLYPPVTTGEVDDVLSVATAPAD